MIREVTEKIMFADANGHPWATRSMAEQRNAELALHEAFTDIGGSNDAQDIINLLYDNREAIRAYLDACDRMTEETIS